VELEKSIVICYSAMAVLEAGALKNNVGSGNGIAVYIGYCADNATRLPVWQLASLSFWQLR